MQAVDSDLTHTDTNIVLTNWSGSLETSLFPGGCSRSWNRFFQAGKYLTIATGYAILRKIAHLIRL